jgi:hypothetical protein
MKDKIRPADGYPVAAASPGFMSLRAWAEGACRWK